MFNLKTAFSFSAAVFEIQKPISKLSSHAQRGQGNKKRFLLKYTPLSSKGCCAFAEQNLPCIRLILGYWSSQKSV